MGDPVISDEFSDIWDHLTTGQLEQLQIRFSTVTPTQFQDNSSSTTGTETGKRQIV